MSAKPKTLAELESKNPVTLQRQIDALQLQNDALRSVLGDFSQVAPSASELVKQLAGQKDSPQVAAIMAMLRKKRRVCFDYASSPDASDRASTLELGGAALAETVLEEIALALIGEEAQLASRGYQ